MAWADFDTDLTEWEPATRAEHAAAMAAWQAAQSPDLAQAEARIDCLLATLFEQSRENAALAGDLVYFRSVAGTMLQTIDRLQREIARKDAEIARMRTDPARRPTRTESIVRGLNATYSPEWPEEVR